MHLWNHQWHRCQTRSAQDFPHSMALVRDKKREHQGYWAENPQGGIQVIRDKTPSCWRIANIANSNFVRSFVRMSLVLSFCPFVRGIARGQKDKTLYAYSCTNIFNTILSADNPRTIRTKRYIIIRVHIDLILFCPRTILYAYLMLFCPYFVRGQFIWCINPRTYYILFCPLLSADNLYDIFQFTMRQYL